MLGLGVSYDCLIYWSIFAASYWMVYNDYKHTKDYTHTHTHVQGYSDRLGQAHLEKPNKGLSGVDWCVGHSFEMPYVALIKITNIKYTTHPTWHGITVFIVVMGEFLFPWFSLTIQPLN